MARADGQGQREAIAGKLEKGDFKCANAAQAWLVGRKVKLALPTV
jgi:hypothetical protein